MGINHYLKYTDGWVRSFSNQLLNKALQIWGADSRTKGSRAPPHTLLNQQAVALIIFKPYYPVSPYLYLFIVLCRWYYRLYLITHYYRLWSR